MNKAQIIAALIAAGVTEANESMTVEQLKALAAEKGVSLVPAAKPAPPAEKPAETFSGQVSKDAYYDAMRQRKVKAGLQLEQAIEVTANQRKWDEANGVTPWLDAAETESPED